MLFDDDAVIAPHSDVLSASSGAGLPVIVMARDFDAAKWMSLVKAGAYDVLRHSAEPSHLYDSVESAMHSSRIRIPRQTTWSRSLLEWVKARFSRQPSPGIMGNAVHGSRHPK